MRWLVVGLVGIAGCGGTVEEVECDPAGWMAHEGDPSAPATASQPFDGAQILAARIGPFQKGAIISSVTVSKAVECPTPTRMAVGALPGNATPMGDPVPSIDRYDVPITVTSADGYAEYTFALNRSANVPPGWYGWILLGLGSGDACGAMTSSPSNGAAWRWDSSAVEWSPVPTELVMRASGCEW